MTRRAPAGRVPAEEADAEFEAAVIVESHLVGPQRSFPVEDQRRPGVDLAQLVGTEGGDSALEAQLAQPVAAFQSHREGERGDLQPEPARVARRRLIEARVVGRQDAREQVTAPGRRARVEARVDVRGQPQLLVEGHEVHDPALEHGAGALQAEFANRQAFDAALDGGLPRQEAGAHAVGDRSQPQVEAGGLHLLGGDPRGPRARPYLTADHGFEVAVDEELAGGKSRHRRIVVRIDLGGPPAYGPASSQPVDSARESRHSSRSAPIGPPPHLQRNSQIDEDPRIPGQAAAETPLASSCPKDASARRRTKP